MIRIKRIKNTEDLKDALCMIHEDMTTFNLTSDESISLMRKLIESIKE